MQQTNSDWDPIDSSVAASSMPAVPQPKVQTKTKVRGKKRGTKPEVASSSSSSTAITSAEPIWANAVCNAWWIELCRTLNTDSGIDPEAFDKAFWSRNGYRLWQCPAHQASVHATAAVLCSAAERSDRKAAALQFLRTSILAGTVEQRVTAYFVYFVAGALYRTDPSEARTFIRNYYGRIALQHGTIYEKTSDSASMAHGWSVAFAELMATHKRE